MASIELDGVTFVTRKRTNKLRVEIAPLLDEKQKAGIEQMRLQTEIERLAAKGERGDLDEDDPALVAGYLEKLTAATRTAESVTPKIAVKVLVDPDGKPPTAKLIDEHAELGELDHVVAVALGTETENPTTPPLAAD